MEKTKKFSSDIDIDFGDRTRVLSLVKTIPATIIEGDSIKPHNTGVYPTNIPVHPITGHSSLDYREAEARGYVKLDFLNVSIYQQIESEEHLEALMSRTPPWHRLQEPDFCSKIIHINNHHDIMVQLNPDSIEKMAMALAVIRPAKRYLLNKSWSEIGSEVWTKPADSGYYFKKSHAIAYAHLVVVHMNLVDLSEA